VELLTSGGDERIVLADVENGLNKPAATDKTREHTPVSLIRCKETHLLTKYRETNGNPKGNP